MNRRFLFIINQNTAPRSAKGAMEKYFLEHGQYDHIYEPTETVGDAWERIASHLHEIDGIITCGGDGTFHHALNAVNELAEDHGKGRRVGLEDLVFGALSAGSGGNDIAGALNMGGTRRELRKGRELLSLQPVVESAVNDDYIKAVDIGYFQFPGQKRRVFLNILGAGYDAWAVQKAKEIKERYWEHMPGFGKSRYLFGALLSLLSYKPVGLKSLRINDITHEVDEKVLMLALMNSKRAGGGLTLNPHGAMDDKALDLVMLGDFSGPISTLGLVGLVVGAFLGKPNIYHPKVKYFNNRAWITEEEMKSQPASDLENKAVQKVTVEFEERVLSQADGDILPKTEGYEAGLCPYQLQVITGNKNSL
jgi:diacylglycerol kinase family enzyme